MPPPDAETDVDVAVSGVVLATHPIVVNVEVVEVALFNDASRELTAKR